MNGFQITFFMEQDRKHHGMPLGEWLIAAAKQLQLQGATIRAAAEGYGRSGRIHSAHFFELTDQPLEFVTIVSAGQMERLFDLLKAEKIELFYVRMPVEFGVVDGSEA